MELTQIRDGKSAVLELEGAIDTNVAAELKGRLIEALETGKDITVYLERVTAVNILGAQLLWAARRDAERAGRKLCFAGAVSKEVTDGVTEAGIDLFSSSAGEMK